MKPDTYLTLLPQKQQGRRGVNKAPKYESPFLVVPGKICLESQNCTNKKRSQVTKNKAGRISEIHTRIFSIAISNLCRFRCHSKEAASFSSNCRIASKCIYHVQPPPFYPRPKWKKYWRLLKYRIPIHALQWR
jgi:rRNA maturation protein Nop10